MKKIMKATALASLLAIFSTPVVADSNKAEFEALERQIEALQTRIAALESQQTFTSFMPDFSERFHVMHRAGEAGDWAVASHELEEMKRLTNLSTNIDANNGELMQQMMKLSFEALENAIGHGNQEKFQQTLVQTIETCNACHTATDSDFIQVTLDARESLSMRHPHSFMARKMLSGHSHGMSSGMGTMMPAMPPADAHHDDTGQPAHKH